MNHLSIFRRVLFLLLTASALDAQTIPGTASLEPNADFSRTMVEGIHRFASRRIDESTATRKPEREKLKGILGIVDSRPPSSVLQFVGDTATPALLHETERARVFRVRWPVLEGVHGEGLYIQPKAKAVARIIYIPDAALSPEQVLGELLACGDCEVVVPALISRGTEFSVNERLGIKLNISHREWVYRQCFELGRHLIGCEIQKVLSVVDWFAAQPERLPVLVGGVGEGGLLALHAAAIDLRIDGAYVAGYFAPREGVWKEPLDRNVFGLLRDFGDAEVASLIAPRPLAIHHFGFPEVPTPPTAQAKATPGALSAPDAAASLAEVERARKLVPGEWIQFHPKEHGLKEVVTQVFKKDTVGHILKAARDPVVIKADESRQKRQMRELETFSQRLVVVTETERDKQFWKKLPLASVAEFEKHTATERERFWNEVIGRLPDPDLPMNAKSRFVRETELVTIYEVTLDVWQDVFAWGWLCIPKDLKPGGKRPAVVCQHGLEGLPEDVLNADPKSQAYGSYKAFALRLAEQGFITFAPHNPYRGKDAFRTLQRKLNPLGLTLYSVINGQHQRILEWLKMQPFIQPERIAFYGLSYGGKSAMRTPAVLTGYCLSICSGDFNEWVRKCVSIDMPMSYIHTGEYEIWEWNMGRTFNYAEMAALIAPRPFMVERGHDDGVGIDEWVNYEYAKVRRLYNKLRIGDRTVIEHFDGPHTIHGVGTYEFLKAKLGWRR